MKETRTPNEPVEKVTFLKTVSCWIKNRELFSVIKSFSNPWCNVSLFMIFFLLQYHITQSGSFTQSPDHIDAL